MPRPPSRAWMRYPNTLVGSQDDASSVPRASGTSRCPGPIQDQGHGEQFGLRLLPRSSRARRAISTSRRLDIANGASDTRRLVPACQALLVLLPQRRPPKGRGDDPKNVIDPTKGETVAALVPALERRLGDRHGLHPRRRRGGEAGELVVAGRGGPRVSWDGRNLSGKPPWRGVCISSASSPRGWTR